MWKQKEGGVEESDGDTWDPLSPGSTPILGLPGIHSPFCSSSLELDFLVLADTMNV